MSHLHALIIIEPVVLAVIFVDQEVGHGLHAIPEQKQRRVMWACAYARTQTTYVCMYVCVCVCGRLYVLAKQARQSGNRTEEDPNETQYLSGGVWYVRAIPCTIKAQICTNTNAHT